ncbi:hypothetical protein M885DRAFT_581045, partial [Pelagophyceae sp. CCMP2097]
MGGPSLRTVKRLAKLPRVVTLSSDIEFSVVMRMFESFVFSSDPEQEDKCLWRIMFDDVKLQPRLRVDEHDCKVRGLCYHAATAHLNLEIRGEEDIDAIKEALENGSVHYSTECTNFAVAPIRRKNYSTKVVATSGGCLKRDPRERTLKLLEMVITIWKRDPRGEATRGPVTTVQPDGAPAFVNMSQGLFFSVDMTAEHPIHYLIAPLVLFCNKTGEGVCANVTSGCEQKHVMKRFRERAKSPTGVTFCNRTITGGMLRRLLAAVGFATRDLDDMFATGFIDAMNVAATVAFLRAVASLRGKAIDDFGNCATLAAGCYDDLQLMALFCGLCATLIADKRPSLSEQLANISTMMHISFTAHRRNKSKYIANQTYLNQQRMFRSIFWSVAFAIKEGYDEYFIFQDSGDALENIFNITRGLFPGSAFDLLQFGERLACSQQVDAVYARRPELRRKVRHLDASTAAGPDDHTNPTVFLSTEDGGEDLRRVDVKAVNLQNVYFVGRLRASAALLAAGFTAEEVDFDAIAASAATIDLLRPHGRWIGVSAEDDDAGPVDDGSIGADADVDEEAADEEASDEEAADEEAADEEAADEEAADVEAADEEADDEAGVDEDGVDENGVGAGAVVHTDDDDFLLEEALPPLPDAPALLAPRLRRIMLEGVVGEVTIAAALRLKMRANQPGVLETGRVARNRGQLKAGTVHDKEDSVAADAQLHAGEDPLLAILSTVRGVTAAVIMPSKFLFPSGRPTACIDVEQFNAKGVQVIG